MLPELAMFGGGGALLAGLSWLAVTGYRRRQFRFRRPGRAIPATPHDLVDLEKQLRAASLTGLPDVTWLNQAMRSLVHSMAHRQDRRLPDLLAVQMSDDRLELILAAPHTRPPEPWHATPDGTRWTVHRHDQLPFDPDEVPFHFAPYPALATIGHTADGDVWLVDLERIGALTLTGAIDRCLDLARALAAELAHNVWSEQLQVSLVGFGQHDGRTQPGPAQLQRRPGHAAGHRHRPARRGPRGRRRAGCGRPGQPAAQHRRGRVGAARGAHRPPPRPTGPNSTTCSRRYGPDRSAPRSGSSSPTTPAPRTAAPGPPRGRGRHHAPSRAGRHPARPASRRAGGRRADPADGALRRHARSAHARRPRAAPLGHLHRRRRRAAAAGHHRPRRNAPGDRRRPGNSPPLQPVATGASRSVLPQPDTVYVQRAAVVAEDLDALAPGVGAEVRQRVEADTSSLDQDLADWYRDDADRPKLQLLGPVGLTLPNRDRSTKPPRMAMSVEVITYLATRRHGATVAQIAAALWPRDPDILDKTLSQAENLLGPTAARPKPPHRPGPHPAQRRRGLRGRGRAD